MSTIQLKSAIELARQNGVRFPSEGADYRQALVWRQADTGGLQLHVWATARAAMPGVHVADGRTPLMAACGSTNAIRRGAQGTTSPISPRNFSRRVRSFLRAHSAFS